MSGDDRGIFVKPIDKGEHVFRKLIGDAEGVFVTGFREAAPELFCDAAKLKTNDDLDTQRNKEKHEHETSYLRGHPRSFRIHMIHVFNHLSFFGVNA
jgi:hypothetical protein